VLEPDALTALAIRHGIGETLTRHVLIVDDDVGNLDVLRAFLDGDYVVHEALSAEVALALLEVERFDVIVCDQRMPGMTGIDLLTFARERFPDVAGILLTAFTDTPVLVDAINRARVFRHMHKPWEPEDLLGAVAQASAMVHERRLNARLLELLAARTDELKGALDQLRETQHKMLHLDRLGTIGRLTAGVTHDLRNTLGGLTLLESLFEAQQVSPRLMAPLRVGVAATRHLMTTLATVHEFAAGSLSLRADPTELGGVVRDALVLAGLEMEQRRSRCETRIAADLPLVRCDRARILQVLVNLLRNAMQSTEAPQVIQVEATESAGGVVIAVQDQGPGVAPGIASRLFDPFESTKGAQGLGMGLYMCRLIMEQHGGSIRSVAPVPPGVGARFEIDLPKGTDVDRT
jgi:signal transduction histidine kinase